MKNVLFVLALVSAMMFSANDVNAQTEQGTSLVGGSSNLDFAIGKTDNDQDDSETNIALNARVGYFFTDGIAGGLDLGVSSSSVGDFSSTGFGIGPFVRYYLESMVFGELGYKFGSSNTDFGNGDSKFTTGDLGIAVGYAIMMGDNIALEPMLNFHLTSIKPDEGDSISGSNFGLDLGFVFFIN